MSNYINELIQDIKTKPETWLDYKGCGITKDNIVIAGYNGLPVFSVLMVYINDKNMPITYIDKFMLEKTLKYWYKTIQLEIIVK